MERRFCCINAWLNFIERGKLPNSRNCTVIPKNRAVSCEVYADANKSLIAERSEKGNVDHF